MGWLVEHPPGRRKPRRWEARYRNAHGKERSAGTFFTKREAHAAIATQEALVADGRWQDPSQRRVTVAQWVELWTASRRKTGSTAAKVSSIVRVHVLPKWGDRPIASIKAMEVRGWVADLQERYTSETTRTIYATFNTIMRAAVEEDVLLKSPCRLQRGDIAPPMADKDVVLSPQDLSALEAVVPMRYKALVHVAAWTGLRWGEVAALRWSDVDLEAGVIHVVRAQREVGGVLDYGPPKGAKVRDVRLDPLTVEVLRAHRRDFYARELVFTGRNGGALRADNFRSRVWNPAVKALGLDPRPTFHDLRHTHISHLVASGVDIVTVARRAGHSKVSMTARYSHVQPGADERVVEAIAAVRSQPSERPAVYTLPVRRGAYSEGNANPA